MVWILLLFSEFLLITDWQHVIFESIGQMAGAISYQHAKLTLNLSSIFTQFERYESALEALKVNLSVPVELRLRDKDRNTFVGEPVITIGSIVRDVRRMNLETITLHQEEVAEMSELIDTLRNILPEVGEAPDSIPPIRAGRSADFKKAKKRKNLFSSFQGRWNLFWWSDQRFQLPGVTFRDIWHLHGAIQQRPDRPGSKRTLHHH
jgi:hypothetical protein